MAVRTTSFGTMEILSETPRVERMTFVKKGRSHVHKNETERCHVLSGSGKIVGASREDVSEGESAIIPPGVPHYMIPHTVPFTLLISYE